MKHPLPIIGLLLSFLSPSLMAKNIAPNTYTFTDNDTIPIILSSLNLNRLVVRNDNIITLDCPAGFCTSNGNKNDTSGSITLRLNIALPFTAQVTTQKGRNFTLFITPRAIPALVSEFVGTANIHNEKSVFTKGFEYPSALATFTQQMMHWSERRTHISGFTQHDVDPDSLPEDTHPLGVVPQTVFVGQSYSGIIYRVINQSKTDMVLSTAQFYGPLTRSASIEKETLAPNESTRLYIVTGGEQ
jgi:conjugal transfer pilus assembly protein TraK